MLIHSIIFRNELEQLLEEEKRNAEKMSCEKRQESEKFQSEVEGLRIELDEKNKSTMEIRKVEEEIRVKGKDGLSGRLREDFDKIVDDHKMELERNYQKDKENLQKELDYQCQAEKQRVQEDLEREKKRLNDDIARERDELEKSRKKCQEEMEEKGKTVDRFSQDNSLKNNDSYSSSRGMPHEERWQDNQDDRDFARGENGDSPSKYYGKGKSEEFSPAGSKNDARYDETRYPNSACERPISGKHQIEYESPSCIENNESRNGSSNSPPVSEEEDRMVSHSYEEQPASKDLYYVTPGSENALRSDINELRRENEGLKAKIAAMEENIDLHRTYKAEVKEELTRLQKDKNELQSKLRNEDMGQARDRTDELEEKLRESEAKAREFEEKIKELNERLSKAENRSCEKEPSGYPFEDERAKEEPLKTDGSDVWYASSPYRDPTTTVPYSKDPGGDVSNEPSLYGCMPTSQENVYGYPSETKSEEYKRRPYLGDTTASNCGSDSYRSSFNGVGPSKSDYSDRFGSDADYPRVTRPDLYTSHTTTTPLYGSHTGKPSSRSTCKPHGARGKYKSFGEKTDSFLDTSSPRSLKTDKRDKNSSFESKGSRSAKKKPVSDKKHSLIESSYHNARGLSSSLPGYIITATVTVTYLNEGVPLRLTV